MLGGGAVPPEPLWAWEHVLLCGPSRALSGPAFLCRFTLETESDLREPLRALGLTAMFDAHAANFSSLSGGSSASHVPLSFGGGPWKLRSTPGGPLAHLWVWIRQPPNPARAQGLEGAPRPLLLLLGAALPLGKEGLPPPQLPLLT